MSRNISGGRLISRGVLAALMFCVLAAQAEDLILVVPGSHLDIGFTDTPAKVQASRIATLDAAIDAAEKDAGFRWTEEASWVVHAWLERHANDVARKAKLKSLVQSGRFAIGATYVNPHASLFPRSLHHLFAFNDVVEREFGVRPAVAVMNDVPSFPEALVDAAAAAGVRGFLLGTNLGFSPPLSKAMTSGPFIWRSSRGAEVVAYADPNSYTAAWSKWGIDPVTARFFNKAWRGMDDFAVAEAGIAAMWPGRSGLVAVEHAFDNWGCEGAKRLPAFAAKWNAAGKQPRIQAGTPAEAFAAWSKLKLPTLQGEWGGDWEIGRAACPVTVARLRAVAERTPPTAPLERRLAIAAAMDHSGGMGPGWPNYFTEEQTKAENAEWAEMFSKAIGETSQKSGSAGARASGRANLSAFAPWIETKLLSPRLVWCRHSFGRFYFPADAQSVGEAAGVEAAGRRLTLWARLDRTKIPNDDKDQVHIGWSVPLVARLSEIHAWPVGSDAGVTGRWLRGEPPQIFIAPDGLVIETAAGRLTVTSNLAFAYRIANVAGRARLQALLVSQSRLCHLKGGEKRVLPFADLYPGEPAQLDAELVLTLPAK